MANLRIALIGCGKLGQKHLQALVRFKRMTLVATVDPVIDKAQAAAVAFDADAYGDVQTLWHEKPDLDAVIIATPSGTHRTLVEEALDHHVHVMVERPLALSVHDASEIVDLARQTNRIVAVTQLDRFAYSVELALDAFRQGRLGSLIEGGMAVRLSRPQSYYDAEPWRATRSMGGGILFNQAIHALDILLQFTGDIDEVFCYTATRTHRTECEDTLVATLKTRDGALFSINATTSVADSNLEERIALIGEQGSIVLAPTLQQVEYWRLADEDEEAVRQNVNQIPARSGWQSHLDALQDFAQAIERGGGTKLSAASVLPVIRVIEELERSAAEHRAVALPN